MTPTTPPDEPLQYSELLVARRTRILKGQRRARLDHALAAAGPLLAPASRVLDLGCADGILWPDLRGRVAAIVGVNYDDWLTQQCRKRQLAPTSWSDSLARLKENSMKRGR